jgi:protein-S-isoprenylcysteine O-methyltransferase Ste14
MRAGVLLAAAMLVAIGAFVLIRQGTQQQALFAGGLVLLVGLPLLGLARRQLGSAFAVTPQAKGLVTRGLYSKIPHPMYVFLDLALLGAIVVLRQAWLLVIWAGLVLVQVWQARREAKVLEQAFGDTYRHYRRRTWW